MVATPGSSMSELVPAHVDVEAVGEQQRPPLSLPPPRLLLPTLVLLTTSTSVVSSLGGSLVPQVSVQYGVALGSAQWILTGPMLVGAVTTPVLGRLGGNTRRRPVILSSLVIVSLGLLLAAMPTGFAGLVAGRLMQGLGIALLPLALAAARDNLSPERANGALALLSVTGVMGAGISYPLAAWLAETMSINAAYGAGFLVTAFTLVLAMRVLPDSTVTGSDAVHWTGAVLLSSGTLSLLLALTVAPHLGATSMWLWLLVAFGVGSVLLWVRVSLRHTTPLVDLRLATGSGVVAVHFAGLIAGMAGYMLLALVMIQVQMPTSTGFGLGEPLTVAGLLLTPYALFSFIGSRLSMWVAGRIRLDLALPLGGGIYVVATVLYMFCHDSVAVVGVVMALAGVGSGFAFAAMPGLVIRETPAAETGSALSFNVLLRFLGFAVGSTLATTVLTGLGATGLGGVQIFRFTVGVNAALWVVMAATTFALISKSGARSSNARAIEAP